SEKSKISACPGVDANPNTYANTPKVILFMTQFCISETNAPRARCSEPSGDFPTPSPPGEKANASDHQTGQTCAHDGTWYLARWFSADVGHDNESVKNRCAPRDIRTAGDERGRHLIRSAGFTVGVR